MGKWNDTDEPLAYLITFRTYGTWLHGDERGSVSRHRNKYGTKKLPHETIWIAKNTSRMTRDAVKLDARQRASVRAAIRETCKVRDWALLAVNIRTNHVHAVVSAALSNSGRVLNALKANSTRLMRVRRLWAYDRSPWADKGSTRFLWNEESVSAACNYVLNGQGEDLPEFN
jgi:REP element-mobilizing transposase RayT